MATPPSARGRKTRLVRSGERPDDLLLVIRATPFEGETAVAEMVDDAELSARHYVVEAALGSLEVLHGVSVFARRAGSDIASVLERFTGAPSYVEVAIGALRAAGFMIYPTGVSVDHFDIQLIGGVHPRDVPASRRELHDAAGRVLAIAGPQRPNPAYAGGTAESQ